MKVVRKTRQTMKFDSLTIGEQFEQDGNVYLKIAHENETPNAVLLSGLCGMATFEEDDFVAPVEIELHVFDKG